jgi:hypothetical protein
MAFSLDLIWFKIANYKLDVNICCAMRLFVAQAVGATGAEGKPEPSPKPPTKRAAKAAAKPTKTSGAAAVAKSANVSVANTPPQQQQPSWAQLHSVDNVSV